MDLKDYLTNEKVRKKFTSQFDLVNYAIRLATNMIMTGRDARVKVDSQNRAMHVMSEILNDKDHFDEIIIKQEEKPMTFKSSRIIDDIDDDEDDEPAVKKERKKPRKILAD